MLANPFFCFHGVRALIFFAFYFFRYAHVQMRLGREGYKSKVENQMAVAAFLRSKLKEMTQPDGTPRFDILDTGDTCCLPVVGARLHNPDGRKMKFDDIELQHALAERCVIDIQRQKRHS